MLTFFEIIADVQEDSDKEKDYIERVVLDILENASSDEVVVLETTNKYKSTDEFRVDVRSSFLTSFHTDKLERVNNSLNTVWTYVRGLSSQRYLSGSVKVSRLSQLYWSIAEVGDDCLEISVTFFLESDAKRGKND